MRGRSRRGNAIILAAAILALLVILATAFIVRTQTSRDTAAAFRQAAVRDSAFETVAQRVASIIGDALFVREIDFDTSLSAAELLDSNRKRLPVRADAVRYGFDGSLPFNVAPFHVVPFTNWPDELPGQIEGIWPAGRGAPNGFTGLAEGNPVGNPGFGDTRWLRDTEPLRIDFGGFTPEHDTFGWWRHLTYLGRDDNGIRVVADLTDVLGSVIWDLNVPVEQWLHAFDSTQDPDVPLFLSINFNQSTGYPRFPGGFDFNGFNTRWNNWFFNYATTYRFPLAVPLNLYDLDDLDGDGVRLEAGERPMDAFTAPNVDPGWPDGTPRWHVERRLADTDGDGMTDALWHMLPGPTPDGVIHLVAVSVVDNAGKLNANVAGRFRPGFIAANAGQISDIDVVNQGFFARAAAGETPSDLALVGQNVLPPTPFTWFPNVAGNWNTGFLDIVRHREPFFDTVAGQYPSGNPYGSTNAEIVFNRVRWADHLIERGFRISGVTQMDAPLGTARERRLAWLRAGSRPFDPDRDGFTLDDLSGAIMTPTPFTLSDELELRLFHGQNMPWLYTRFERSLNAQDFTGGVRNGAVLRAHTNFEESSRYLGRLNLNELLHDHRRKLTVYNSTRNDLLPPWLWWRWTEIDPFNPGQRRVRLPERIRLLEESGVPGVRDRFMAQSRTRVDLREMDPFYTGLLPDGELRIWERLPLLLCNVFSDGTEQEGRSYFGTYTDPAAAQVGRLRRLAAGLTANILAARSASPIARLDGDPSTPGITPGRLGGAIPLPEWGEDLEADPAVRMLGMKPQPFIMEAFVGHLYEMFVIPDVGWDNAGERMILETNESGARLSTSIAVVQIANPYPEPILLSPPAGQAGAQYQELELVFFGAEPISLTNVAASLGITELPAATEERPSTMIFYAIDDTFRGSAPGAGGADGEFKRRIRDFLDILPEDHPDDTIFVDVGRLFLNGVIPSPWPTRRDRYDQVSAGTHSIVLRRLEPPVAGDPERIAVVIDRAEPVANDARSFTTEVRNMGPRDPGDPCGGNAPPRYNDLSLPDPISGTFPCSAQWSPGTQPFTRTHWMQWRRWTRAFGHDADGSRTLQAALSDLFVDSNERAPRFVIGEFDITAPADSSLAPISSTVQNPGAAAYRPFPEDLRTGKMFPAGGGQRRGNLFLLSDDPESATDFDAGGTERVPWFTRPYSESVNINGARTEVVWHRKPTFFDMNRANDPLGPRYSPPTGLGWSYPDKGFYATDRLRFPFQMLHKGADFQQVGEVLNLWLYGHELAFIETGDATVPWRYSGTTHTFSELLVDANLVDNSATNVRRGRVEVRTAAAQVPGGGTLADLTELRHAQPPMPAISRLLDAFVCDGPGLAYRPDQGDVYDNFAFGNAMGFSGRGAPGLINLNTATVEVMRAVPHWYKMVHAVASPNAGPQPYLPVTQDRFPRIMLPEAVVSFRERFNNDRDSLIRTGFYGIDEAGTDQVSGPNYAGRTAALRAERGMASVGELLLLTRSAPANMVRGVGSGDSLARADSWRADFAGRNPFNSTDPRLAAAFISTDVTDFNRALVDGDRVGGDVEEQNLLVAGAANLVTTRSDTFTVYFRLRSVRRNPRTGLWDATDPEYILDDQRYVMLVDRSQVNRPGDMPRILFLERAPE